MNDNSPLSVMSRECVEAESILSRIDQIQPRRNLPAGLVAVATLCFATVVTAVILQFI
jgi:hypothetical protein